MFRLTDKVPLDSFQLSFRVFPSVPHLNFICVIRIFEGGRLKRRKGIILRVGDSCPKWRILKVIIIKDDPPSVIIDEKPDIGQKRDSLSLFFDKGINEGCLVDALTDQLRFELCLGVLHSVWML